MEFCCDQFRASRGKFADGVILGSCADSPAGSRNRARFKHTASNELRSVLSFSCMASARSTYKPMEITKSQEYTMNLDYLVVHT